MEVLASLPWIVTARNPSSWQEAASDAVVLSYLGDAGLDSVSSPVVAVGDRQSVRGMVEGGYVRAVEKPSPRLQDMPDMPDIVHLEDQEYTHLTSDAEGRGASSALEDVGHWTWCEPGHSRTEELAMSWSVTAPVAARPQRCLKRQHRAGRTKVERKAGRAGLVDFLGPPFYSCLSTGE